MILKAKNDFAKDGNKYSEKDILEIINKDNILFGFYRVVIFIEKMSYLS